MGKLIYIVEDQVELNELVRSYLEKEGYDVKGFFDYGDAINHINDDVHLWLLDIMLGEKNGYDLIEKIRDIDPKKPVIFMSARDQEFDRIIGLEKGSDDYIAKPFSPKELVLRVNNVMRRSYQDQNNLIRINGYVIDSSQRIVHYNEELVDLTMKEYDLLLYFINNRRMAILREQILDEVWDQNYVGSDRVVDDTLRRVRKKMPNLNIHTLYGYGYRLD